MGPIQFMQEEKGILACAIDVHVHVCMQAIHAGCGPSHTINNNRSHLTIIYIYMYMYVMPVHQQHTCVSIIAIVYMDYES